VDAIERARDRMLAAYRRQSEPADWARWQEAATDYWLLLHPDLVAFRRGDPDRVLEREEIDRLASEIRTTSSAIRQRWAPGSLGWPWSDPDYIGLAGWHHEVLTTLYVPIWRAYDEVRTGDRKHLETLLRFLECDPYCFRSGYAKGKIIHRLTQRDLDSVTRDRLRAVLFNDLERPGRSEFRKFIRLARYLDSPELRSELETRAARDGEPGRRQARWILEGLHAADRTTAGRRGQ
jgi:hypothetical protein